MDKHSYVRAVQDGLIEYTSGEAQAIPHWGEADWIHLFCVRHAEKIIGDPGDAGLTAEGMARAEHLGRILSAAGIDAVYSTTARRAVLTAEPTQRRAHTPPMAYYEPEEQDTWLETILAEQKGKKLLVVGHQYTVPHLLNLLVGRGFDYDYIPNSDYGQLYIVATQGPGKTEIIQARY